MAKVPVVGELAPDFELPDSTRVARRLSQLILDTRLVLLFYRGNWWPFCLRQLAEYRDRYPEILSAGATLAAVSVDAPDQSETLRVALSLPFPILCDTEHRVVRNWGIYNAAEKGGLARPAVFMIDSRQVIRYAAVDGVVRRVPAAEMVRLLQNTADDQRVRRRAHVPLLSDWKSAIKNSARR